MLENSSLTIPSLSIPGIHPKNPQGLGRVIHILALDYTKAKRIPT